MSRDGLGPVPTGTGLFASDATRLDVHWSYNVAKRDAFPDVRDVTDEAFHGVVEVQNAGLGFSALPKSVQ